MPLLTVNNNVYDYPNPGTDPGWGEEATAWAQAVTDVLATLLAPGDIIETTFTLDNNILVATSVNGLFFDAATTRAANVDYSIYRESDTNPSGQSENGTIYLTYDNAAASGFKWKMGQVKHVGDAGVAFSVDDTGQISYISTNIGAAGYSATMRFRARTLGV